MPIAQSILPQFDQEMAGTRKTLERVPDDKFDWKAHPKCNTIGWVAAHLADIPSWVEITMKRDSFDVNPVGGQPYRPARPTNRQEIVAVFDKNVASAHAAIAGTPDGDFMKEWSLLAGGNPIFKMPRIAVLQSMVISHSIHHRAFLCAYLRMNDIPVPALYGPSGDES
jgi:DinB superfamily